MSTQTIFINKGSTAPSTDISLAQNAGSTAPGDPILGLLYNTAGLTCYYREGPSGAVTTVSLLTQTTTGAYSAAGFCQVDSVKMPGVYRFDLPLAIVGATGEWNITFAGTPAGTVGNMETHTVKVFVGDVMGIIGSQMTESYAAAGVAPSLAQAIFLMQQFLMNQTITAGVGTVKKLDNATTAATMTYNDPVNMTGGYRSA